MIAIVNDLQELGLTKTEAKVYLALHELGEAKTGRICDFVDIPTSHIYRILDGLGKKGLVSYKYANNVRIFQPTNPDALNVLYEKKIEALQAQRETVQNVIKSINLLPKRKETESNYKYFEGISGIKAMWLELTENLKPNDQARIFISDAQHWKQINAFYVEHHKERKKKNVVLQMLVPNRVDKALIEERKAIGKIEIRQVLVDNQAEFGIYGDMLMMQYTDMSATPRSFLIRDEHFVDSYKTIFSLLWKQSKKL